MKLKKYKCLIDRKLNRLNMGLRELLCTDEVTSEYYHGYHNALFAILNYLYEIEKQKEVKE